MSPSPKQIEEGAWRLRDMLPEARKLAAEIALDEKMSGLGSSVLPHLYEANFRSLVVIRGEKGGWIADLHLRDVPAGVPNIFGTPVSHPHETHSDALAAAKLLLAGALAAYKPDAPGKPVFLLHDVQIDLHAGLLTKVAGFASSGRIERLTAQAADQLAMELRRVGFHDACTLEDVDRLVNNDIESYRHMLAVIHAVAALGVMVWPRRTAGPFDPNRPPIEKSS